jgi:DNA-binding transcriptional ArsR family regulator
MERITVVTNEELRIDEPAVVAALYDPLRYRLFRLLETPRSVGELAREVDMPANRLYYHVRRLVDCGLIRQVDARASGRHTERIYGRAAERIRFSGELDLDRGGEGLLRAIVEELEAGMRDAGEELPARLSYHVVHLTPGRAAELEARLGELIDEYEPAAEPALGTRRYGLLGALSPLEEGEHADGDS